MYARLQRPLGDVMRNTGCALLCNYLILCRSRLQMLVLSKNRLASELFLRLLKNQDFKWEDDDPLHTIPHF